MDVGIRGGSGLTSWSKLSSSVFFFFGRLSLVLGLEILLSSDCRRFFSTDLLDEALDSLGFFVVALEAVFDGTFFVDLVFAKVAVASGSLTTFSRLCANFARRSVSVVRGVRATFLRAVSST